MNANTMFILTAGALVLVLVMANAKDKATTDLTAAQASSASKDATIADLKAELAADQEIIDAAQAAALGGTH